MGRSKIENSPWNQSDQLTFRGSHPQWRRPQMKDTDVSLYQIRAAMARLPSSNSLVGYCNITRVSHIVSSSIR